MKQLTLKNGATIAYDSIEGEHEKPWLIFLHEGLGSMTMWKGFPEALCHHLGWPGLMYDRQGHGHSSPLSRQRTLHYLHEYALQELPEVIDKILPVYHPYFLIGHSDGGSIALIHASEQPQNLKGIIIEAAHIFVEPETTHGIALAVEKVQQGTLHALQKYHGDKTDEIFYAWAHTWLSPHFRYWNIEYLLPSILVPVMVMQGETDQYATMAQLKGIVDNISGQVIKSIIPKCGHAPHLEHQDEVIQQMAEFLKNSV